MLPRDTSLKQLKKLREETKGKDIGDITAKDRLNHNIPNLQYIGNPIDTGIDSYEEYIQKDNKLQTIAFKSKLVNKPIVKENNQKNMKNIINFNEYHNPNYEPLPSKVPDELEVYYLNKLHKKRYSEEPEYKKNYDKARRKSKQKEEENDEEINKFAQFAEITESKEEKQPKYTMLGSEKEPKSNDLYGIGQTKDYEIKKLAWFNNLSPIDPPTPKERPILNAGQFVHTEKVRGYINRIEGNKVFVESLDEPTKIIEISLKDAVKPPIEQKEEIKKFNEISEELNKEFLKDKK